MFQKHLSFKVLTSLLILVGLTILLQVVSVDGRPASPENNKGQNSYNYPVPKNPLELPERKRKTTSTTTQVYLCNIQMRMFTLK